MTTITLPKDLEDWARAEVAAGRAASVEHAAQKAIAGYRARMEAFRTSLDEAEAEADREGWLDADAVFAELKGALRKARGGAQLTRRSPRERIEIGAEIPGLGGRRSVTGRSYRA